MTSTALPDLGGKTILQVIPELSAGGAERTTLEVADAIIEAGGRALIVSEGGRLVGALEQLGAQHIVMPARSKNLFTVIANAGKLTRLIGTEKVDLIHARSRAPAWSAFWASRRADIAFVTTYHGAYSGVSGLKKLYNSVMARGDLVIANSEWTSAHVQETHGTSVDRLETIPRGVDFALFDRGAVSGARLDAVRTSWKIGRNDPRLVLLLPGRLTGWKGQKVAVEALARLPEAERSGLLLILAGDAQGRDDYVGELESAISVNGLDKTVSIVGHCEDMPAAYAAADIVLAPSSRPEAFGRVAAEASALGKPVIVADHGGQRETVVDGETGLRAKPGDAGSLCDALRALLRLGPEGRASMGAAGRDHVTQRFSKRGLQAATLNVYKRVIEAREDRLN